MQSAQRLPARRFSSEAEIDPGTGDLLIYVDDSGPGIPPELYASVLGRFGRASSREDGHGLGLAIVKAVAEAHAGSVGIAASRLGGPDRSASRGPLFRPVVVRPTSR